MVHAGSSPAPGTASISYTPYHFYTVPNGFKPSNPLQHVAIIMDGNGRWALQKGLHRSAGHQNAITSIRSTIQACLNRSIPYLTFFAFSQENWQRPPQEVQYLMELLILTIQREQKNLIDHGIRVHVIGAVDTLPVKCQKYIHQITEQTAHNDNIHLTFAISYSGQWDIIQATKSIVQSVVHQKTTLNEINEQTFAAHLPTNHLPNPDLIIRTGGETRISNFFLWQIAYAEIYFCPVLWPDFRQKHFLQGIDFYQKKERRFGKIPSFNDTLPKNYTGSTSTI